MTYVCKYGKAKIKALLLFNRKNLHLGLGFKTFLVSKTKQITNAK